MKISHLNKNKWTARIANILMIVIILLLFFSCAATKSSVSPKVSTINTPILNKISGEEIGAALVTKETGFQYNAIKIINEFNVQLDNTFKTIEVGTLFINTITTNTMDLYSHTSNSTFGIAIPKNGDNPLVYSSSDSDGIYTSGYSAFGYNFIKPKEKLEYISTTVWKNEKAYFKQEFIYNGRVGNALKFIYREFINDYARPSFTQELQYDLSESDIIGFRGLRIQIINATNTTIEYKVLNYFEN